MMACLATVKTEVLREEHQSCVFPGKVGFELIGMEGD